jgi:hypothetical protein
VLGTESGFSTDGVPEAFESHTHIESAPAEGSGGSPSTHLADPPNAGSNRTNNPTDSIR